MADQRGEQLPVREPGTSDLSRGEEVGEALRKASGDAYAAHVPDDMLDALARLNG